MKSGETITSADIDDTSQFPCHGGNGLRGFTNRFTHSGRFALIGRQGALCGNVIGVSGQFFASEHAVVVTAFPQTDVGWLTYMLGGMRLNRYSESSAQPGLSIAKLLLLDVACPPTKAEQRAIAAVLSDVDKLIESLEALIAKKRVIKQAVMQELLTGRTRLPGFGGEWEGTALGNLADIRNGGTPRTGVPSYWGGRIPWCVPTDITARRGKYLAATARSITPEGLARCGASLLPVGALLLCSRATIGEIKIASMPVATNQGFKSLVCGDAGGGLRVPLLPYVDPEEADDRCGHWLHIPGNQQA